MRKIVLFISFVFLLFIDIGSKVFVEDYFFGEWKSICLSSLENSAATSEYCLDDTITLTSFLSIELSYNKGIAFSLPIHGLPLQILTIILTLGIVWMYLTDEYKKKSRLLDSGYILILAGAVSHAYERIINGYVVDFIGVKYFAILNFADIFISLGAFLIIIAYVRSGRKSR